MNAHGNMMATNVLKAGGGDGDPTAAPPNMSETVAINLKNHCLFCLQPQEVHTLLEVARRDPKLSKDPRLIIHYLTGTDPSYDTSEGECEEMGIPATATFLPMTCPSCYEVLAELYKLLLQLMEVQRMIQKQTEVAREMIINSQNLASSAVSSRQQFYLKIQSSEMSLDEITTVAKFVDNFQTEIIFQAAAKDKIKFPARLPSDSPSKYDDNIKCSVGHASSPSITVTSPNRTSNLSTVAGDSNHFQTVNNSCSERDPMELDSMVIVKHETGEEETETGGEDLFGKFDSFLASKTNTVEGYLPEMRRNEDEGEGDQGHFSPSTSSSSSSTDQSSSSCEPSSPEPTTSKRRPKRKCNEIVKTSAKAPKVRKFVWSSRRKPTSAERSDPSESHLKDANSSESEDEDDLVPLSVDHLSSPPGTLKPQPFPALKGKRKCIRKVEIRKRKPRQVRPREEIIRPLVVQGSTTSQHCDICGELCPSSEIKVHLETKHHLKEFLKKCPNPSCPYVFSCKRKLDVHLSMPTYRDSVCRREAKLKNCIFPKKCEVCRFQTKMRVDLLQHLCAHEAAISEKSLNCPITECFMKFAFRQSVEEHLYLHHDQRKDHGFGKRRRNCDICGEKISIPELRKHLEDHNLKDYVTHCPNPLCTDVYSCRGKMETHLHNTPECRKVANLSVIPPTRKCESCNLEVSKHRFVNHLHRHELQFKDKETIPCPIASCPDRYVLRQSMEEHLMSHDRRISKESKEQECSVCNQRLKMDDVKEHLKEIHDVKDIIKCRRCPFLFHGWEALLDHLENHRSKKWGGRGFFCDMCDDDSRYFCEVCEQQFFSQTKLSLHHEKMHPAKPQDVETLVMATKAKKTFECDQCPDTCFLTKQTLLSHKIKEHGEPPVTCKFCNKEFVSFSTLRKHEQAHMGVRKSYRCRVDNCGRVFPNVTHWKDHERAHNDDPSLKLFVCDICGKRFNNRPGLYGHTRQVHTEKKPPRPVCDICGESFATAASLKRHNLIHTGERPFQCTICSQAFRHGDVLKTHLKSHEKKGDSFKPNGPMKNIRRRVAAVATATKDDQVE